MATKLTVFASLASILLLGSCSQEEILNNETTAPRKAIGYNVTAERATRAQNIFSSTNTPTQFIVGAWHHTGSLADGVVYFDSDLISKDASSSTYSNTRGLRYWPTGENDKLNFYAYAGDENASFSLSPDGVALKPALSSVTVDADAANHNDIIYACVHDEAPTATGSVNLTFSHAMAQVAISAKNTNENIHVEVAEVALGGLPSTGTFYFGTTGNAADGADAVPHWGDTGTAKEFSTKIGTWTDDVLAEGYVEVGATAAALTERPIQNFMLIPGNYDKADAAGFTAATATGSYLRVKCKIWNVANAASGKQASDVQLYDGDLYIPCDFNLAMGKKYTYTLNFGQGTAGMDENGKQAMVALDIATVSVSDWQSETPGDLTD